MKEIQDKKTFKKRHMNPALAMATGAVVGVGAAIAGMIIAKDKNNQAKAKKILSNVKNKTIDNIETVQGKIEKTGDKLKKGVSKL